MRHAGLVQCRRMRREQKIVAAGAIAFMIARLAFWSGYRKHPQLRAPGMPATAYLNLGMTLCVLYYVAFVA